MDKFKTLNIIKQVYENDGNIIQYLKEMEGREHNSLEDILISYDFQAGSYIELYEKQPKIQDKYCKKLAEIIDNMGDYNSIIEVGVGEATTLGNVLKLIKNKSVLSYGFDISWSRIKYAKKFLGKQNLYKVNLFVGDLFCLPLKDNSMDIVYTSHSIEPNGGKEKEALMELYRITNKYLILLEPAYEYANEQAKNRMIHNGYVTNLYLTARELGYEIIEHKLFGISSNPLNPTGLIIIKKDCKVKEYEPLCCPITKNNLTLKNNCYFSKDSFLLYPIIDEIPFFLPQNAILASKFLDE
ncbi:methyltransferase domain-containing protein [Clostridium sporogenes]|uniref:Methyltransferase domain-containing protein n=1 Tax=Clostridium botulinum TaxID=1491 RepID=A0A6M0SXY6_CLOBO|nr:methyltransferase domain-containing protein [Clostridium sporogenes]NFA59973.1 methyltransferase domain-containing protein [Clostridium botulinum]NFI73707.1 methyltransferase domain-containing protein [Clostridium sporogenes]NFL72201.1 methyltransferase domain-containing protein [Clostridium sporogenes]NFM23887.1 methyltransferase domain-containing protein [Clostridium sporogenes]NFP61581.1 methyltransferase domain-containing protein [Clostridium sporogenes]